MASISGIILTGDTSPQKGISWSTSAQPLYTQKELHQCTGPNHPVPFLSILEDHAEWFG